MFQVLSSEDGEDGEVEVQFLKSTQRGNMFEFPLIDDIAWIEKNNVINITQPKISRRGDKYHF